MYIGDRCKCNMKVHWGRMQEHFECTLGVANDTLVYNQISINVSLLQNDEKKSNNN